MFALNYEGLKKRESYDEIVDYLMRGQEKIKFPNRLAKQLRESPQLSNLLDGEGLGVFDIDEQQNRNALEVQRQQLIRDAAGLDAGGVTEQRVFQPPPLPPFAPPQTASSSSQTQFPKTTRETQATQARPTLRRQSQESTTYIPTEIFHSTPEVMANVQGFVSDVENLANAAAAREREKDEIIRRMVARNLQQEIPTIPYLQRTRSPQASPVQETMEMQIDAIPDDPMNPRGRPRALPPPYPKTPPKRSKTQPPAGGKQRQKNVSPAKLLAPPQPTGTYQEGGASSSSTPAAKTTPAPKSKPVIKETMKQKREFGTKKDTSKSLSHWNAKGVGYLIDQLEHYGVRLERGQKIGKNKLKKQELLAMIREKLNI